MRHNAPMIEYETVMIEKHKK